MRRPHVGGVPRCFTASWPGVLCVRGASCWTTTWFTVLVLPRLHALCLRRRCGCDWADRGDPRDGRMKAGPCLQILDHPDRCDRARESDVGEAVDQGGDDLGCGVAG